MYELYEPDKVLLLHDTPGIQGYTRRCGGVLARFIRQVYARTVETNTFLATCMATHYTDLIVACLFHLFTAVPTC